MFILANNYSLVKFMRLNILNLFLTIPFLLFLSGCGQGTVIMFENENSYPTPAKGESAPSGNSVYSANSVNPVNSSILFVGDLMFDRHIRQAAEKQGNDFILEKIKELLSENDFVVANLEGPITDNRSVSVGSKMETKNNFIFTFDPTLTKTLAEHRIKIVNLGNNHIFNFGVAGVSQTKKYLAEAGIEYFGDVGANDSTILTKEKDGLKLVFINYNYAAASSRERTLEALREAEKPDSVSIVCPHWGEEYRTGDPGPAVRRLAHEFVDAGADLVIGTHPHVVQDSEEYQGKKIYYSLGNFVFDQYFSPETQKGLAVRVSVNPKDRTMEFQEISLRMQKNCQTIKAANN